jgi:uncharacterized protein (UPF0264 family)
MSLMLASVNSHTEARLVYELKVDIIDLKQPELGALGALNTTLVTEIVADLPPDARISATIGDLPMQPELVVNAARNMATTGVDYIKIGFFPDGNWPGCINGLADIAAQGYALIAVLFADTQPNFAVLPALAEAGFRGVMLDTMDKGKGSLTGLMTYAELEEFVSTAGSLGLLTGLAGSLREADISGLLSLEADYLGFRGALCQQGKRTAKLDKHKVIAIQQKLVNTDTSKIMSRA